MKRITVEIDISSLTMSDLHKATGAIAILEESASREVIAMTRLNVSGKGLLRKKRSDAIGVETKSLQPQQEVIYNFLMANTVPSTAREIAKRLDIKENSIRAQLRFLERRGLIHCRDHKPRFGKKNVALWQAATTGNT